MPAAVSGMFLQDGAFAGGLQTLRLWNFALLEKTALSERSEFAVFSSALSKIPKPESFLASETAPSWRNIPDTAAGTGSGIGKNVMLKTLLYSFEN